MAMVIAAVDFVPAAAVDDEWCVLESAACFVAHLKEILDCGDNELH